MIRKNKSGKKSSFCEKKYFKLLKESIEQAWDEPRVCKDPTKEHVILKDGKTIAYEGLIEYKQTGLIRSKTMTLSVFKDNKIISITVGYLPHTYSENLKKILYSLEF